MAELDVMAELTVTAFVTLDGVTESPAAFKEESDEFKYEGWMVPYADAEFRSIMKGIFSKADAFLFGAATYNMFSAYWPKVSDSRNPIARTLNRLPKHVVSSSPSTLAGPWENTFVVWDILEEVRALKSLYARELQVHGSVRLVQTLMVLNVVDVYHLLIAPITMGYGIGRRRLFSNAEPCALTLEKSRTTPSGVMYCAYRANPKATGLEGAEVRPGKPGLITTT